MDELFKRRFGKRAVTRCRGYLSAGVLWPLLKESAGRAVRVDGLCSGAGHSREGLVITRPRGTGLRHTAGVVPPDETRRA